MIVYCAGATQIRNEAKLPVACLIVTSNRANVDELSARGIRYES
jgi:hypothetical protein